jgi:hypothetical protein
MIYRIEEEDLVYCTPTPTGLVECFPGTGDLPTTPPPCNWDDDVVIMPFVPAPKKIGRRTEGQVWTVGSRYIQPTDTMEVLGRGGKEWVSLAQHLLDQKQTDPARARILSQIASDRRRHAVVTIKTPPRRPELLDMPLLTASDRDILRTFLQTGGGITRSMNLRRVGAFWEVAHLYAASDDRWLLSTGWSETQMPRTPSPPPSSPQYRVRRANEIKTLTLSTTADVWDLKWIIEDKFSLPTRSFDIKLAGDDGGLVTLDPTDSYAKLSTLVPPQTLFIVHDKAQRNLVTRGGPTRGGPTRRVSPPPPRHDNSSSDEDDEEESDDDEDDGDEVIPPRTTSNDRRKKRMAAVFDRGQVAPVYQVNNEGVFIGFQTTLTPAEANTYMADLLTPPAIEQISKKAKTVFTNPVITC